MSILDGYDLDESTEAEQTLPLEQRIVIFLSDLPHDSLDKGLNVKATSLVRLKHYHIFRKTAQHQESSLNFVPGLAGYLELRSHIDSALFGQIKKLSIALENIVAYGRNRFSVNTRVEDASESCQG